MGISEDLDDARDACLECCSVLQGALQGAVLQIWEKHEPDFMEPLECFENALVEVFIRAGEVYESAVQKVSFELNGVVLLANHGQGRTLDLPPNATTFHEVALRGVLQVLEFGGIWSDVGTLWPEGELRQRVESRWKQDWGKNLHRFLSHQRWMMGMEKLPVVDAEGIGREIQLEWAAARASVAEAGPPSSAQESGENELTLNDRMMATFSRDKRCVHWGQRAWAKKFDVTPAAVGATAAWAAIMRERAGHKQEKRGDGQAPT